MKSDMWPCHGHEICVIPSRWFVVCMLELKMGKKLYVNFFEEIYCELTNFENIFQILIHCIILRIFFYILWL